MKVTNMTSSKGNKVPNQFIIESDLVREFQSYKTIVIRQYSFSNIEHTGQTLIDIGYPFSVTTSKYASQFLGESSKEIKAKIKSGEYITAELNK